MTCPHQVPRGNHFICQLAGEIKGGATIAIAGTVCDQCRSEWEDGRPPTIEHKTPTLRQICGEPIEQFKLRPECFFRGEPLDRTDGGEPCNCPNRWLYSCQHPDHVPTTRLGQCQTCELWEAVYDQDDSRGDAENAEK